MWRTLICIIFLGKKNKIFKNDKRYISLFIFLMSIFNEYLMYFFIFTHPIIIYIPSILLFISPYFFNGVESVLFQNLSYF